MAIELIPATPADRDFLCEVYASTREEELAPVPWDEAQKVAFVRMQFDAQDRYYREQMPAATFDVVMVDGVRAGRLYVDRRAEEIRIVDVALLPAWRGAGTGTALLRTVFDEADACAKPVTIHVEHANRARTLYERLGFRQVSAGDVYGLFERPAGGEPGSGATRRQVLQAGAAGGAALMLAGGPSIASAAAASTPAAPDLTWLRRSAYTGLVGRTFRASGSPLRLAEVSDVANAADRGLVGSEDTFVLRFTGTQGALGQGVHAFRMPDGGGMDLFAVPVDNALGHYEVLVDRSVRLATVDPPRPAPTPEAAAAAAPAAATPAASPAGHAARPDRRYAFLKSVSVTRGRPGLRVHLGFARKAGLRAVGVRVTRDGVVYARGRSAVRGRRGLVGLKLRHPLPHGRYDLVIQAVDRKGVRTTVRRSVRIR